MFTCSGILFNHESPLRGAEFVTRKIIIGLTKVKLGQLDCIELGNLDAKRDWGYASDYVEAMYLMLQHSIPDDYVVATGENHSVRDFINAACRELKLEVEWQGTGIDEKAINTSTGKTIVKVNPQYFRPAEVDVLLGDSAKAQQALNWTPKTSFDELVSMMVKSDYDKLSNI
jgi:GDPmannose 4,6-dehydratase